MITLAGQLTPSDYLAATSLHTRRRGWERLGWVLVWAVLAIGALVFGIITIRDWRSALPALAAILLIGLTHLFLRTVYVPHRVRRIFNQQRSLQLPFNAVVTADGIDATNANGKTQLPWSHMIRWKEDRSLFIVYQSDVMFTIFPKRLFAHPDHVDAFRALLTQHVGAAA